MNLFDYFILALFATLLLHKSLENPVRPFLKSNCRYHFDQNLMILKKNRQPPKLKTILKFIFT